MDNLDAQKFSETYKKELDFLKEKGGLTGEWSNVYDHCFTEGRVAAVFGGLLRLSAQDTDALVKAALLHDWYKRKEREATKAKGAGEYDQAARKSAALLQEAGYSEDIVLLTQSVGHTSLKTILESDNFLHKLMHYIDDITFNNQVTGVDERLKAWGKYQELNELGRALFGGKTYSQVQQEVGHKIEQEVASHMGCAPEEVIPTVKARLQEAPTV